MFFKVGEIYEIITQFPKMIYFGMYLYTKNKSFVFLWMDNGKIGSISPRAIKTFKKLSC
jgi:hypothetical protein